MIHALSTNRKIEWAQILLILIFSFIPVFVRLPFRINLFLAWEGAYRLSLGQIPYRDFSLPTGFGFWLIPAFFFKIFGPSLHTLLIAQAFINCVGALSFRSILKKLGVESAILFLALLIYCLSFVLVNFWPWYNNSVYIFELVGLHFLVKYFFLEEGRKKTLSMALASFFFVLSFFTKQDGGALAILTAAALTFYNALADRKLNGIYYFVGFCALWTFLFVVPFIPYQILDSFNYGQPPHNARANLNDFLIDIFEGSQWIKFYMLVVMAAVIIKASSTKDYFLKKKEMLFTILTFCILCQALIIQVTSYIPHNVNVYFHSFGFAFLAYLTVNSSFTKISTLAAVCLLVMFWWSADYWSYGKRIVNRISPGLFDSQRSANQISKYTWQVNDSTKPEKIMTWKISPYASFKHVLLPEETIQGIDEILKMDIVRKENLRVLNMSELTPLEHEIGFEPLRGQPLWFHKNVAIFDRDIAVICKKIEGHEYDMVLFEVIPYLNNFYPQEVRTSLQKNYKMVNSFAAPREKQGGFVEVYVK